LKTRAAVVPDVGEDWKIEEIEVHEPKAGELIVEWKVAGLCHSDEHVLTGDLVPPQEMWEMMGIESLFPMIGGHE
jgi:Zn-dependent alcohol dehydrogenase